jgi:NRPS condensation-like uncharacterized protein
MHNINNPAAKKAWYKLDNIAKIFPPTSSKSNTKVFRFCCELTEDIIEDKLQSALDATIEDFPGFRYVLKHGMFWYYLEQSSIRPAVHLEDSPPCSTIYVDSDSLLFRVIYYGRRINLEVYHVLADGTGALQFLKTLIMYYLKFAHPETMGKSFNIGYDASETQKMTDGFSKYYDKSKNNLYKTKYPPPAYQLKGARETEWRLNIIEGSVSVKEILAKAREHNATITAFITAIFIRAIYSEMSVRDTKKPVVINTPVNLRNFFASKSTRNFYSHVDIKYDFKDAKNTSDSLEDIIKSAGQCLSEYLNIRYLQTRLNKFCAYERNFFVRILPLAIKNLYLSRAYSFGSREVTAIVSNMGKIEMPEEAKPYIKLFDVFNSTEKMQICICSYEDTMNISITSPFVCTDIQRNFFRELTRMGISVKISANNLKGENATT